MQLIDELIDLLSDESSSIQRALLKAQVLGHKLGDAELSSWVEHELRGYPESIEVPPYRRIDLSIRAHVTNGVYLYKNQTIAVQHLQEPLRTNLTHKDVRDSVSAIEGWRGNDDIAIIIPAETYHALSEPLSEAYFVQQAWGKPSVGAFEQIIVQVRSRLLEFCLRISDKLPADLPSQEIRKKAEEMSANDIFRNAVFGDNATIVVGGGSIANVKNKVVRHDIHSLKQHLQEHGVSEGDISNLETAVAEDSQSPEVGEGSIGPSVRAWIGTMVGKAGTTAWQVSIGAAGNILGSAIAAYYGFGT